MHDVNAGQIAHIHPNPVRSLLVASATNIKLYPTPVAYQVIDHDLCRFKDQIISDIDGLIRAD